MQQQQQQNAGWKQDKNTFFFSVEILLLHFLCFSLHKTLLFFFYVPCEWYGYLPYKEQIVQPTNVGICHYISLVIIKLWKIISTVDAKNLTISTMLKFSFVIYVYNTNRLWENAFSEYFAFSIFSPGIYHFITSFLYCYFFYLNPSIDIWSRLGKNMIATDEYSCTFPLAP